MCCKYSTILVFVIIRCVIPLQNFIELCGIIIPTDLYLPCSLFPLGDHLIMMNQLTVLHTDVHVIKGGCPMKDTLHLCHALRCFTQSLRFLSGFWHQTHLLSIAKQFNFKVYFLTEPELCNRLPQNEISNKNCLTLPSLGAQY